MQLGPLIAQEKKQNAPILKHVAHCLMKANSDVVHTKMGSVAQTNPTAVLITPSVTLPQGPVNTTR